MINNKEECLDWSILQPIMSNRPAYYKVWPDMVGMKIDDVKKAITQDGEYRFVVIDIGSTAPLTEEIDTGRVRLYVDKDNIVVKIPNNG
jgi:hypothetical protein